MDFINGFLGLALMAGNNALFLWPAAVLVPLAVIFLALSWKNWRTSEHRSSLLWLLVPSIGTVLILLFGTVFQCGDQRPCTYLGLASTAAIFTDGFLLLQFSLIVWMVVRLRELKSVTLILGALQFWYACLAAAMAQMTVTGNWL